MEDCIDRIALLGERALVMHIRVWCPCSGRREPEVGEHIGGDVYAFNSNVLQPHPSAVVNDNPMDGLTLRPYGAVAYNATGVLIPDQA